METAIPEQNIAKENEETKESIEDRVQNIEVAIENLKPKSLWERIKGLIVGYIVAVVMLVISWYLVGVWTIAVAVVIIPASYLYTKYIYKPPFTPILVVGHKDPNNPKTTVLIDAWGIPPSIMDEINLYGIASPLATPWGVTYLAENLKFDNAGNLTDIVFAWPHNSELNFLRKHSLFHYLRQENLLLTGEHNTLLLLLQAKALRIGYKYATTMIKVIGDEKIAKGLKGIKDEKDFEKFILDTDEKLRELRKEYDVEDVIDIDEADLVPEG